MRVNLPLFYFESHICESLAIYQFAHVRDQGVDCLAIYFIFFQLTDIQDADVVQPLASIEPSKDEQFLCAEDTGGVSLSASRSLLTFNWVTPAHSICVQHVQVIRRNNLLEGATSAIVASE